MRKELWNGKGFMISVQVLYFYMGGNQKNMLEASGWRERAIFLGCRKNPLKNSFSWNKFVLSCLLRDQRCIQATIHPLYLGLRVSRKDVYLPEQCSVLYLTCGREIFILVILHCIRVNFLWTDIMKRHIYSETFLGLHEVTSYVSMVLSIMDS